MEVNIIRDFNELLRDFEATSTTFTSKSIFDIAGYPHYENVCSNILAFYLDPNNEHGLGSLLLSSLMAIAGLNEVCRGVIQVSREVSTNTGGRIDIVIETDRQIIGIENKIFHQLNNDLEDYSAYIDECSRFNETMPVKIVLGIRKEECGCGFISITYEQYWAEIRRRLGEFISTSSQKWALYFVDFMSAIEGLYGASMEIDGSDKFFIDNEDRVNALINARNKFLSKLNSKVRDLLSLSPPPSRCKKQWIYNRCCLVHDFVLSGYTIAFDLIVSSQGWELQAFGRNVRSQAYLAELFSMPAMAGRKIALNDSRFILQKYELSAGLDVISRELNEWFELVIQADCAKSPNDASEPNI